MSATPQSRRVTMEIGRATLGSTREPRRDVLDVTMRVTEHLGILQNAVSLRLGYKSRVRRAHRVATNRRTVERAAAVVRTALPHLHPRQRRGRYLPRPDRILAVGAGDRSGDADPVDSARSGGHRSRHATADATELVLDARRGDIGYSAQRSFSSMPSAPTLTVFR